MKTQIREYTKLGEGVDRVYRDMEEAGLPEPVYRQSEFMLYATLKNKNWGKEDASWIPSVHDENQLLEFCATPKTRREMMSFLGLANRSRLAERNTDLEIKSKTKKNEGVPL